jgi:hypothetical protein
VSLRIDRFEMKFVVTAAQRTALMENLDPHLRPDANGGTGATYPVVSLYYDNAERDCYWEKLRGLGSRRKLRVRVYGSRNGAVREAAFIEVKHKCEGRGVKRRVALPLEQALRAGSGSWPDGVDFSEPERRVIHEVHDLVQRRNFKPVMVMRYDRSAYAAKDPGSDLRVTFDTGIRSRLDHLTPEPDDRRFDMASEMHADGTAVMEVKITGCIPYWLSRMIAAAGCRLQSHSKYSAALEQGDPVLRAMLVPAWRSRIPCGSDTEMEVLAARRPPALETAGGTIIG